MNNRRSEVDGDDSGYGPEDEPGENPALSGELPALTGRRIVGQVFFLAVAIGLIVFFATDRDEPEPEPEPEPVVIVDGPTVNHRGHEYQLGGGQRMRRSGPPVAAETVNRGALPVR